MGKLKNRCFCWFPASIFVPLKGTRTWRLHFRISRIWNIAQTCFLARIFAYLSSFIPLFWTVSPPFLVVNLTNTQLTELFFILATSPPTTTLRHTTTPPPETTKPPSTTPSQDTTSLSVQTTGNDYTNLNWSGSISAALRSVWGRGAVSFTEQLLVMEPTKLL